MGKILTKLNLFFKNKENIFGVLIIITTILIYHFLSFVMHAFSAREGVLRFIRIDFWESLLLPGIISAILFYSYSKKINKAFIVGAIAIIVWILWLALYVFLIVEIN